MKYQFNLEIINNETGEIINIKDLCYDINRIEIEELSERIIITKQLLTEIMNVYRVVEYNFINNMNSLEAKKIVTNDCIINLKDQTEYNYDTEKINKIKGLISEEEFNSIFTEYYKVNRTKLKGIISLGGEIKKLSESMQQKIIKKPTVSITFKE